MYRNQERGDKIRRKKKKFVQKDEKEANWNLALIKFGLSIWNFGDIRYRSKVFEIYENAFLAVKNSLWWFENTSFKN